MRDQTSSSLSKVRLLLWKSSCRYFCSNPQSTGKGVLSFVISGSSRPSSAAEADHGCPWRFILSSQKANSYQIHPRSLTPGVFKDYIWSLYITKFCAAVLSLKAGAWSCFYGPLVLFLWVYIPSGKAKGQKKFITQEREVCSNAAGLLMDMATTSGRGFLQSPVLFLLPKSFLSRFVQLLSQTVIRRQGMFSIVDL